MTAWDVIRPLLSRTNTEVLSPAAGTHGPAEDALWDATREALVQQATKRAAIIGATAAIVAETARILRHAGWVPGMRDLVFPLVFGVIVTLAAVLQLVRQVKPKLDDAIRSRRLRDAMLADDGAPFVEDPPALSRPYWLSPPP